MTSWGSESLNECKAGWSRYDKQKQFIWCCPGQSRGAKHLHIYISWGAEPEPEPQGMLLHEEDYVR